MKQHGAVKVRRAGTERHHSYIVTIPREVAIEMGLEHGDYLKIESDRDTIVLRKMKWQPGKK